MTNIIDSQEEYVSRILATERPNEQNILAWYEHRLGAIFRAPRMLLMPMDDHLAHRGDGVFETIQYEKGTLHDFEKHLSRMRQSSEGIHLTPPCSWETIRSLILEVAAAGKEPQGHIRALLGRGAGGFGISPSECPEASLYIVAYKYTPHAEAWYQKGVTGFRTSIPAKQGYLAKIKNANYLPNVLMMIEAEKKHADVPFCFDEQGFLAESAVANICIVDKNGVIIVPEFSNSLSGTTITRAISLLGESTPHKQKKITEEDIIDATEVLVLGTGIGCASVISYEGSCIGSGKPGGIGTQLRKLLHSDAITSGTPIPGLT